jgi:small subunit ribosomal protein S17e
LGKAVPKTIKHRVSELIELYPGKFTTDFEKNKEFVKALELPLAKSTINKIIGYITKSVKKEAA